MFQLSDYKKCSDLGCLFLISTPIGNLFDISIRALEVLSKVDSIICEDTRVTKKLLSKHKIFKKSMVSYNDHNATYRRPMIIKNIIEKKFHYAMVTDSGTPLISDPGYKLVNDCIKEKIKITHIPGPSSVISGLILSGLSTSNFFFGGFLEKTIVKKEKQLLKLITFDSTSIWFENPNRVLGSLQLIRKLFGNRKVSVLRELTKFNEEIIYGSIDDVIEKIVVKKKLKGEIIIAISGYLKPKFNVSDLKELILQNVEKYTTKELSFFLSDKTGLPKNFIYNEIIKLKKIKT